MANVHHFNFKILKLNGQWDEQTILHQHAKFHVIGQTVADILQFSTMAATAILDFQESTASMFTRMMHITLSFQAQKPSFSANPSHRSLPFLLQDRLHELPGLFTDTSELICFSFSTFSC